MYLQGNSIHLVAATVSAVGRVWFFHAFLSSLAFEAEVRSVWLGWVHMVPPLFFVGADAVRLAAETADDFLHFVGVAGLLAFLALLLVGNLKTGKHSLRDRSLI